LFYILVNDKLQFQTLYYHIVIDITTLKCKIVIHFIGSTNANTDNKPARKPAREDPELLRKICPFSADWLELWVVTHLYKLFSTGSFVISALFGSKIGPFAF